MNLEKFFRFSFFGFLFSSTFSGINFFFGNGNSYISGNFSSFSSIIFTLSDLFLFLSIFLFLIILYFGYFKNTSLLFSSSSFLKSSSLSFLSFSGLTRESRLYKKIKSLQHNNRFPPSREGQARGKNFSDKNFNILFSILFLTSFFTSFFTENFWLHFSILIKFFSVGFLFFYVPEKLFSKKEILNTLIFSFVIQGFIAFFQVIFQNSVGLKFLGENNFSENTLGLAKISLANGENFIRGYGSLSHPNILGLGSLILYFLSRKSDYFFLKNFLLIGIFFSFSKTAIIGFFILKIYEILFLKEKNFFDLEKIFHKKINIFYKIFYPTIIFSFFIFFHKEIFSRFQNFFGNGFEERIEQFKIAHKIIYENILHLNLFGNGFGGFSILMQNFSDKILKPWEIQPVHNFFLLFGVDVGILGFLSLVVFISYIFIKSTNFFSFFTRKKTIENQNHEKFFLILILFFASFFDHFLLTSGVGIILFWLILRKIKKEL